MAFDLDFTSEFFFGDEGYDYDNPPPKADQPTSVLQALVSMHESDWDDYCRQELHIDPTVSTALSDAMKHLREINTCTDIGSPVEVWLEAQGFWTVMVHKRPS